jgi:Uma2 family endonuclease
MAVGLAVRILTDDGEEMSAAYLVRLSGWTEERYFREAPETRFVEFEDGEVIVHSPVGTFHQRIVRFLTMLLQAFVRRRGLGEVLHGPTVVRFRPGLNYEPDIFFIPQELLAVLDDEYFSGTPALVVEILSPGTRTHDLVVKPSAYRRHGVREYWVVDLERRALVRHLLPADPQSAYQVSEHAQGRLECQAIPGFWLDVAWLWQDPLPDELSCLDKILTA